MIFFCFCAHRVNSTCAWLIWLQCTYWLSQLAPSANGKNFEKSIFYPISMWISFFYALGTTLQLELVSFFLNFEKMWTLSIPSTWRKLTFGKSSWEIFLKIHLLSSLNSGCGLLNFRLIYNWSFFSFFDRGKMVICKGRFLSF